MESLLETQKSIPEIKKWILLGESETLEFKKSTAQLDACGEALCGFLNHLGGNVFIGISSTGELVGQTVSDRTLQEIANMIKKISPEPKIEIHRIPLPASQLELILFCAHLDSKLQPFIYDGRPYIRRGTTTSRMTQERYHQALLEKSHSTYRWELSIAEGATVSDLDHEEILATLRLGKTMGRIPEHVSFEVGDILDRLKLRLENKFLKKAALVLFGKNLMPEYSQCKIQLARFKGTDKAEFLDNKHLYGNSFQIFNEAMLFLQRHLPITGRIDPHHPIRVDELLFPYEALREALVNAICHRDYLHYAGSISVGIYEDRLEIWNTGSLPIGITLASLKQEHQSIPRNPLIAEIFYKRGLIENWGRGTQKIVELCTQAGHPEPEFLEQAGSFLVRFIAKGYNPSYQVSHDLSLLDREILDILSKKGLPMRELKKALRNPPAEKTISTHLTQLKRLNLLHSQGRGRGTLWSLRKSPK